MKKLQEKWPKENLIDKEFKRQRLLHTKRCEIGLCRGHLKRETKCLTTDLNKCFRTSYIKANTEKLQVPSL